jgi:UDP-2,3-diacylglucosamine pyrophosphatase LpxH
MPMQTASPAAAPPGPDAADQTALAALAADPPETVLVVSDLHLSAGRDPVTGRFDRIENFFADDAFARWLAHHHDPEAAAGALVVLNGDTFDFLRVLATPRSVPELEAWRDALASLGVRMTVQELEGSIDGKERRYGLGTEDFKCVWKLGEIVSGHPAFFAGLRGWLRAGGRLLVVKGNHDVELHWPLVRRALRQVLGAAAPGGAGPRSLVFCDDFARLSNLHLEHGHQYEEATRVEGAPTLVVKQGDREVETIRLPSGSFVNRYLINSAEDIYPFLDNARPLSRSIRLILRRHPYNSLRLVFPAVHLISRSWRISGGSFGRSILLFLNILGPIVGILVVALVLYLVGVLDPAGEGAGAQAGGLVQRALHWVKGLGKYRYLLSIGGVALPYVLSAIAEWREKHRRGRVLEDEFSDHAYRAFVKRHPVAGADPLYIVFGHTHNQDAQLVPPNGGTPGVMYLNSGTWTPLFIDDRPDLIGRAFRPFIRFDRGGPHGAYTHRYLQWNDERGAPDPIEILGPVRLSGWEGAAVIAAPEEAQPAEPGNAQPAVGP